MFHIPPNINNNVKNLSYSNKNFLINNLEPNHFNILYLNARDITNKGKISKIEDLLIDITYDVDIIIISETWIRN